MKKSKQQPAPVLKRYRYEGPLTSVTLRAVGDVRLVPGQEVSLPPASKFVQLRLSRGWLVELTETPATTEPTGALGALHSAFTRNEPAPKQEPTRAKSDEPRPPGPAEPESRKKKKSDKSDKADQADTQETE